MQEIMTREEVCVKGRWKRKAEKESGEERREAGRENNIP